MAAPGKYSVSLTAGGQTQTRVVDPRVTRDGVTQLDLDGQLTFQIKVRDAISEARKLAESVNQAMQKANVRPPAAAPVGTRPMDMTFEHPLQKAWATINDMPGAYPQPMLLNQFNNVQRMIGQGDQRIGKDAVDAYTDLMKNLAAVQAEFQEDRSGACAKRLTEGVTGILPIGVPTPAAMEIPTAHDLDGQPLLQRSPDGLQFRRVEATDRPTDGLPWDADNLVHHHLRRHRQPSASSRGHGHAEQWRIHAI